MQFVESIFNLVVTTGAELWETATGIVTGADRSTVQVVFATAAAVLVFLYIRRR